MVFCHRAQSQLALSVASLARSTIVIDWSLVAPGWPFRPIASQQQKQHRLLTDSSLFSLALPLPSLFLALTTWPSHYRPLSALSLHHLRQCHWSHIDCRQCVPALCGQVHHFSTYSRSCLYSQPMAPSPPVATILAHWTTLPPSGSLSLSLV